MEHTGSTGSASPTGSVLRGKGQPKGFLEFLSKDTEVPTITRIGRSRTGTDDYSQTQSYPDYGSGARSISVLSTSAPPTTVLSSAHASARSENRGSVLPLSSPTTEKPRGTRGV